jgi:hypothetical protein
MCQLRTRAPQQTCLLESSARRQISLAAACLSGFQQVARHLHILPWARWYRADCRALKHRAPEKQNCRVATNKAARRRPLTHTECTVAAATSCIPPRTRIPQLRTSGTLPLGAAGGWRGDASPGCAGRRQYILGELTRVGVIAEGRIPAHPKFFTAAARRYCAAQLTATFPSHLGKMAGGVAIARRRKVIVT